MVICSENPEDVADRISEITLVSDYRLIHYSTISIRDVYWDNSEGTLRRKRISLRLRKIDNNLLVTIKGGGKLTDWGGVERLEIEVPWSPDGFYRIIDELKSNSIDLPLNINNFDTENPAETLVNLGFNPIQDRETNRKIKNITLNKNSEVLAELAIDTVFYKVKDQIVRHFEIEIESKHKNGTEAVKKVLANFSEMFGSLLRIWTFSKLSTGLALEQLSQDKPKEKYFNIRNCILPETYNKITNRLGTNVI